MVVGAQTRGGGDEGNPRFLFAIRGDKLFQMNRMLLESPTGRSKWVAKSMWQFVRSAPEAYFLEHPTSRPRRDKEREERDLRILFQIVVPKKVRGKSVRIEGTVYRINSNRPFHDVLESKEDWEVGWPRVAEREMFNNLNKYAIIPLDRPMVIRETDRGRTRRTSFGRPIIAREREQPLPATGSTRRST